MKNIFQRTENLLKKYIRARRNIFQNGRKKILSEHISLRRQRTKKYLKKRKIVIK